MARLGRRLLLLMLLRLMTPASSLPVEIEVSKVLSESGESIIRAEYWEKFSNFMAKLDSAEKGSKTHLLVSYEEWDLNTLKTMPHIHEFLVPPDLLDAIEAHLSNATWLAALGQEYLQYGGHNMDPLVNMLISLGALSERENVTVPRDILEKLCWQALSQWRLQAELQWWMTGAVHTFFNSDEAKKRQREDPSLFTDFIHNVFEHSWMSPDDILQDTIKHHKLRSEMLEKIEQAHKEESPSGTIDAVTFDDTFTTDDNFWDDPNMSAIFGSTQTPETASTAEDNDPNEEHDKSAGKTRRKRDHDTSWTTIGTPKDPGASAPAESEDQQSGVSGVKGSVQDVMEPDNSEDILEHDGKTGTSTKSEGEEERDVSNDGVLDVDVETNTHHLEGLVSIKEMSKSQEPFAKNQKNEAGSPEAIASSVELQTPNNGKTSGLILRQEHDRRANEYELEQAAKIAEVVENAITAVELTARAVEVQFDKLQAEIEKSLSAVEIRPNEHEVSQSNGDNITKENLELAKASTSPVEMKTRIKQLSLKDLIHGQFRPIDAQNTAGESVDFGSADELETTSNIGWISKHMQQQHKLEDPEGDRLWDGKQFLTNEKPLREVLTGVMLSSRDYREDIERGGMEIFDMTSKFQTVQLDDAVSEIIGEDMIEESIEDFDSVVELQDPSGDRTTEELGDSSQAVAENEEGSGVEDAQADPEQDLTTYVRTETLRVIVEEVGPEEPMKPPHDKDNLEESNRDPGLNTEEAEDLAARKGGHAEEEDTLNEEAVQTKEEKKMVENVRETGDTTIGKRNARMQASDGKGKAFTGNKVGVILERRLPFHSQVDESVGENPVLEKEEQDQQAHESYPTANLSLAKEELTGDNEGERMYPSGHRSHPPLPNHDHDDPKHVHLVSGSFDEGSLHNIDASHSHDSAHVHDARHSHASGHKHDESHKHGGSHIHDSSHNHDSGHVHDASHNHDSGHVHDASHNHDSGHVHDASHNNDSGHVHDASHNHDSGHVHDASHNHYSGHERDESHKHGGSHQQDGQDTTKNEKAAANVRGNEAAKQASHKRDESHEHGNRN